MPIFEYVCEQCGECTEAIQLPNDPPAVECLKCGGKLRKKVSAPAFQFKGSGWYVTDYQRKGESAKGESAKGESAKGESGTGESGKSGSETGDSGKSSSSTESSGGGGDSSAGPVKKADPKPEPASKSSKD
jgi:putative FmdB family regulatory protein